MNFLCDEWWPIADECIGSCEFDLFQMKNLSHNSQFSLSLPNMSPSLEKIVNAIKAMGPTLSSKGASRSAINKYLDANGKYKYARGDTRGIRNQVEVLDFAWSPFSCLGLALIMISYYKNGCASRLVR